MKQLNTAQAWTDLQPGEPVEITGELVTARDATLEQLRNRGELELLAGKVVYFCGPTPAPDGRPIGSCGPTTTSRMEPFFTDLVGVGVKAIVGKGQISAVAAEQLLAGDVPYFSGIGGAGALYATCVIAAEVIALAELGPEAVYRLEVKEFPVVVQ